MDSKAEIRQFLASRRAKITPEQAGLPMFGGNRRVAGLRREEVALLAGVSVDYYTRLERGNLAGASESVLDAGLRGPRVPPGRTPGPLRQGADRSGGELSTRSEEFRVRWAAHNVRFHRTGVKQVRHPVVGELDLRYEAMELSADNGLMLFVYTAEPDSATEQALNFLASWAATRDSSEAHGTAHPEPLSQPTNSPPRPRGSASTCPSRHWHRLGRIASLDDDRPRGTSLHLREEVTHHHASNTDLRRR